MAKPMPWVEPLTSADLPARSIGIRAVYQSETRLAGGRYILSPGLTSKAA
jgi:hypothetical protein